MSGRPTQHEGRVTGRGVRLTLARLAIWWERLWPALWPATALTGVFLLLALSGALEHLPGWLHLALLAVLAAGLGLALWRARRAFPLAGRAAARRRLETSSGLAHRPLATLDDKLALGQGERIAEGLWRAHLARTRAGIGRLRVGLPRAGLAARDPMALRVALVLLVLLAGLAAGDKAPGRLLRALMPGLPGGGGTAAMALDVWITPPAWTGMAPRSLRFGDTPEATGAPDGPLPAPVGSTLLVRLHGSERAPVLLRDGGRQPLESLGGTSWGLEGEIDTAGVWSVRAGGRVVGEWRIGLLPDNPPEVEWAATPEGTARGVLRLDWQARDDFGLTGLEATIRQARTVRPVRPDPDAPLSPEEDIVVSLTPTGDAREGASGTGWHDLTAHPWAGLPVEAVLTATDAAGNEGHSEPVAFTLPERPFVHPVARRLVELRRILTLDPGRRGVVGAALRGLSAAPDSWRHDLVVFLALRTGRLRLLRDRRAAAVDEVRQLLWDTALRIEDGGISLAERALRNAREALRQALADGAPPERLQELANRLQEAMDRFLEAMTEQAMRPPGDGPLSPPDGEWSTVTRDDIEDMMERIRDLMETGQTEAAEALLAQLEELMENLQMGLMQNMPLSEMPGGDLLRQLEELSQQQQALMDQTFRDSQDGEAREGGATAMGAARQETLRNDLGELMRMLGELSGNIPQALGEAEFAMREAGRALRDDWPQRALRSQARALERLETGAGEALQQFLDQFGAQFGFNPGSPGQGGDTRDPLGRTLEGEGRGWGSDVDIPSDSQIRRARRILDELRRRLGDRLRPEDERAYLRRLLPGFGAD